LLAVRSDQAVRHEPIAAGRVDLSIAEGERGEMRRLDRDPGLVTERAGRRVECEQLPPQIEIPDRVADHNWWPDGRLTRFVRPGPRHAEARRVVAHPERNHARPARHEQRSIPVRRRPEDRTTTRRDRGRRLLRSYPAQRRGIQQITLAVLAALKD